ncbi:hypothetical protein EC912_102739 [Luteibacter rhizovicinus]|uniref:Uncharacterized protein n=1 Tax=Luteibacter rhizovicinus TaxID=242606 RepID=A0A4R3YX30_9GAMM|nr:hypothetical protein [Luteibacter rhizovicinus]TCV96388.1 hypothetical protein EC912_102739 [Luteibacter rhizovicinus]
MKKIDLAEAFVAIGLSTAALSCQATTKPLKDQMCAPLRAFVASVKADETRKLEFHTSWGQNFKDSTDYAFLAKRCIHDSYAPAKAVCDHLMEYGAIEFSGNNATRAIACLSPGTHFGWPFQLDRVEVSFPYGSEQRGSNVTIQFDKDSELGGMVLKITADGY